MVYQLALPHYRQAMLDHVALKAPSVTFKIGDQQFYEGVYADVRGPNVSSTGRNRFFFGRRLGWQSTNVREALSADCVVLELNPRLINSWIVAIARRLARKPTLFWGHVFPRSGAGSRTEVLRRRMRQLTDGMIVYTESEKAAYSALHPHKRVYVAPNAIYSSAQMQPIVSTYSPTRFIVIGRLVAAKKPAVAVRAFADVLNEAPDAVLTIIGAGSEEAALRKLVETHSLGNSVQLMGEITDHETLQLLFSESVALVAPGYVGLNVTQSLGFGVPVIYSSSEPHAPEVEALNGANSIAFLTDSAEDLAGAMLKYWRHRDELQQLRSELAATTRSAYSAETMGDAFIQLVQTEVSRSGRQ